MLDLIPPQLRLAAYALACALLFGAGWLANGWRLTAQLEHQERLHSDTLAEFARASTLQMEDQHAKRRQLETQLADIDHRHYQELQHAQTITDSLTADLAAARQRMSVRTTGTTCRSAVPATAGATGVDDGVGALAELHPATAAGVVRVTGRADQCRARLTALQAWALAVSRTPAPVQASVP